MKMKNKVITTLMISLFLVCIIAVATPVEACRYHPKKEYKTWTVDDDLVECPGADFTNITDALEVAMPKDEIYVYPGEYDGPIEIRTEDITLKSTDGPSVTIIHQGSWTDEPGFELLYVGISILADHVTVEGFTVKGFLIPSPGFPGFPYMSSPYSPGIIIGDFNNFIGLGPSTSAQPVKNCKVIGNVIEDCCYGIYLFNAQKCNIKRNIVRNQSVFWLTGDPSEYDGGDGIVIWDNGELEPGNIRNTIKDNEIYDNMRVGLFVGSTNPDIRVNCDKTKIEKNTIYGNGANLLVWYADGKIIIKKNVLESQPEVIESPGVHLKGNIYLDQELDDDTTAPIISITYEGEGSDQNPGIWNVEVEDPQSGLDEVIIEVNGIVEIHDTNLQGVLSLSYDISVPAIVGINTIVIIATNNDKDLVGDQETSTEDEWVEIKEITPPIITIGYVGGNLDINSGVWNVDIEDLEDGIKYVKISIDQDIYWEGQFSGNNTISFPDIPVPSSADDHVLEVFAENMDSYASQETDLVSIADDDTTGPTITVYYIGSGTDFDPGWWYVHIKDLESGLDEVLIEINGFTWLHDTSLGGIPSIVYNYIWVPGTIGTSKLEVWAWNNDTDWEDDQESSYYMTTQTIVEDPNW